MNMPPCLMRMKIYNPDIHLNLWIPLFIAWIILAVLFLAFTPVVIIAILTLWLLRMNSWLRALLKLGPSIYSCLCALKGLKLDVKNDKEILLFSFR